MLGSPLATPGAGPMYPCIGPVPGLVRPYVRCLHVYGVIPDPLLVSLLRGHRPLPGPPWPGQAPLYGTPMPVSRASFSACPRWGYVVSSSPGKRNVPQMGQAPPGGLTRHCTRGHRQARKALPGRQIGPVRLPGSRQRDRPPRGSAALPRKSYAKG